MWDLWEGAGPRARARGERGERASRTEEPRAEGTPDGGVYDRHVWVSLWGSNPEPERTAKGNAGRVTTTTQQCSMDGCAIESVGRAKGSGQDLSGGNGDGCGGMEGWMVIFGTGGGACE